MKHLLILYTLLILTGCSPTMSVYSDYDRESDLSSYRTFDWGQKVNIEEGKNPLQYNELNDKRIKFAIADQLFSRGYVMSDQAPDLIVHYHIIVQDQSVIAPEPFGYRYGPYWTRIHTHTYSYREGTLIVDLMDRKTNNLVWRGWAVSAINGVYSAEELDRLIKKAIARIFKKFPGNSSQEKTINNIVSN